jgi:soluble lytic murein transglycosylase-like protein
LEYLKVAIMNEESPTYPKSSVLILWICVVVMMLMVFLSPLYQGRTDTHAVADPSVVHEALPEENTDCALKNNVVSVDARESEGLFYPIIQQAADLNDVDPALVKAIIMAESSFNPRAVSKKGAEGLMQLMPTTAKALGVEDSFNPEHNINGGVRYFRQLMDRFGGDTKLALAAYNAGSTKVRSYQGVPPFKATRYYIKKVFEYYQYYKENMAPETGKV